MGLLLGIVLATHAPRAALAQGPPAHFQHAGVMPPGAIGALQLTRGGPLSGYIQPVEIRAPRGARISTAAGGGFASGVPAPLILGVQIGPVYRLQVTNIPNQLGLEVYPTLEIVNRLYPPPGEAWRFPIVVELTQEELELALTGKFVTRIIYLEDPNRALPVVQDPERQNWFEAAEGDDPLEVADRLGRPMAILRMGGRIPGPDGPDARFLYGSPMVWPKPALMPYTRVEEVPSDESAEP